MAAAVRRLAEADETGSLPDPVRIWWEAQLLARRDRRRRLARQLIMVQWAATVAAGAAGAGILWMNWLGVHDVLRQSIAFAPWVCSGMVLTALALRLVFGE